MYRQMTRESPLPQIYCAHEKLCDGFCGKFHAERLLQRTNVRHLVGAIEAAAIKASTHNEQMARVKGDRPQLVLQTQQDPNGPVVTAVELALSPQSTNSLPNGTLSLALPPVSPASPGSQASQTSGLSTSVTLDDIIASARRKISEEYQEIRLPSPEFEEEDTTLWDKRAARKKLLFHESSLDIPAVEASEPIGRAEGGQYEDIYEDSEAELVIQEEPPSYIGDDENEDFEEMLKASKPPPDAFSNPILLRDADPLTTRKKRRHRGAALPRQQSMSRIQQLGGAAPGPGGPFSQRSTPSGQTDIGEDLGDNSSIDMSMTELSAAVAHGKSQGGSSGPSPSHILQFIEEQKQKGEAVSATSQGNTEF